MFASTKLRKLLRVVAILGFLCLSILIFINSDLSEKSLDLVRPTWFYISGLTRYDFQLTIQEQACSNGTAKRINSPGSSETIPRVVHLITGIDQPNPNTLITWLAIRAASINLGPGVELYLHYVFLITE